MRWLTSELELLRGRTTAELTLAFAMATFQTSALLVLIVILAFRGGSLGETLDDLDTLAGIGLFLLLWLTGCYCTVRAVIGIGLDSLEGDPLPAMLVEGIKWGAMNGALFFACLVLIFSSVLLVANLAEEGMIGAFSSLLFSATFLILGAVVAGIIGGAAGFVFAIVYRLLLEMARAVVPAAREHHSSFS